MSKTIELEALDTLFFRDGKPFTMGEDSWAEGIFPPLPSVIYGALRTAYFSEDIERFKTIKKKDDSALLRITSYCFKYGSRIYFPMPLDLIEVGHSTKKWPRKELSFLKLNTQDQKNFASSVPTSHFLQPDIQNFDVIEDGIINSLDLANYLAVSISFADYHSLNDFTFLEPKVGIGLNNDTRAAKDGQLYRVGMQRLDQLSFVVGFEFEQLDSIPAMIRLGGEGKAVQCQSIESKKVLQKISIQMPSTLGKRFKLYLATPALFTDGWKPSWMTTDYSEHNGIKIRLLAAAVGKAVPVGGFDIQKKEPKAMRKAVPAGSVYYLELENETDNTRLEQLFHQKSISEIADSQKQGFGITFVGGVS
ncbi:MAG: type III-B CRISPR module-associated protein Cmr3 [Bacteroidales bacterium]|nr:type III-B CRISPR module-associated protein Cmr3 [Bacteroidales bacterium]